ncbi:MAG: HDOD domain-containing protein [Pseudomonadota bacterium]
MLVENLNHSPLDRIKTNQLPALPSDVTYLVESMLDDSIDFRQLAQVIERFPSIAARLIALANSAWSAPVNPINSLDMACARLGFGVVRSTCIALAVASSFDSTRCPAFNPETFWCHALLLADASTWLAQAAPMQIRPSSQITRTAGLLHKLGLLWLADQLPDETHQAIVKKQNDPNTTLKQALQGLIGIDYLDVGAVLAKAWKMPEPLVTAMSRDSISDEMPYWETILMVITADSMVSQLRQEAPWLASDKRLASLGIDTQAANEVFEKLSRQYLVTLGLASMLFSR